MYVIIAILVFGLLIATHELGHFIAAKACGVKVNEFAVGMGPALLKKQGKETLYSLRLLPIGGYCAMEGEDESMSDPRAFTSQKPWKRIIILVSGAFMNFLTGLLIVSVLYSNALGFSGNQVVELAEGFTVGENTLHEGDRILSIDGHGIFYSSDFSTYMSRSGDTVDMTVLRDGKRVVLKDYQLQPKEYETNGEMVLRYGISFNVLPGSFLEKTKYSVYAAYNFVRYVWMGLTDLVTGAVGLNELSGVVGIVGTISEVGSASPTATAAAANIAYLCAFIAVNLAVMNLLPIPALDGGRIFLLLVTVIAEKILGKKIDPKYEGMIHAIGMALLLALMAYVMFNDIIRLVR